MVTETSNYIEQIAFEFVAHHFTADDGRTRVQGHDIANERFRLAVIGHHVGDLNDSILVGFGENT